MTEIKNTPGINRDHRISDEGLRRLQKQLETGAKISRPVLMQWIRRYGEAAREIIKAHGQYDEDLDV